MLAPMAAIRNNLFQSTHPVRGATAGEDLPEDQQQISIHAPREGCDAT